MELNNKHEWFRLSHKNSKALMIYLFVMLLFGLLFTVVNAMEFKDPIMYISVFNKALFGAMSTSLLGSSIFYMRKLYKACINIDMLRPDGDGDKIREFGIVLYFVLRPIYSMCFAVLTVIIVKSGIHTVVERANFKGDFVYFIMVICFFVGYSLGDFIDAIEAKGKNVVRNFIITTNE